MPEFRAGQIIPLHYKSRGLQVLIIAPHGPETIACCEKMVGLLDLDDIEQAHDLAIQTTQVKFGKHFLMA